MDLRLLLLTVKKKKMTSNNGTSNHLKETIKYSQVHVLLKQSMLLFSLTSHTQTLHFLYYLFLRISSLFVLPQMARG